MKPFGLFHLTPLLTLAVGYIVLCLAKKEEKGLKVAGYIIGGLAVVMSLIVLITGFYYLSMGGCRYGKRPMMMPPQEKQMMPPGKGMPPAPPVMPKEPLKK